MQSPAAAFELQAAVQRFCALEERVSAVHPTALYHAALAQLHDICASVLQCEAAGMDRASIVQLLEPARAIHARAPFVRRLQDWPRGYTGDFETVDYICRGRNDAPSGTLEYVCQAYSLNFPIAQQHRNKVQHQAARILKTMMERPRESRILALACGGAPDFALIAPMLENLAGEIWLNDADEEALVEASRVVEHIRARCRFIHENAMKIVGRVPGGFDLVLAGGLFDYLPDRAAIFLLRTVYRRLLRDGGTFFFTNIARDNPFRCLIEYIGDWFLIERSEDDVIALCREARIPGNAIALRREETGLAVLVEITKEIPKS
ncbi:MAG TPA: class I SAM-dependent methyltransferase [Thermoanaerobaculia bacterium]|nr:class I SAM-dependent methyltransferase [Thermoanaerobaculia bacterium]